MVKEDMLDVKQLRDQCTSMIDEMNKSNEELNAYIGAIVFFEQNDLDGLSYATLKKQMDEYIYLGKASKLANTIMIRDCQRLMSMIGDEKLDGKVIFESKENAEKMLSSNKESLAFWTKQKSLAPEESKEDYHTIINIIQRKIVNDKSTIKYWEEKMQKFDDISDETSHLFEFNDNIRFLVRQGIKDLSSQFTGEGYNNKSHDSWKNGLENLMEIWSDQASVKLKNKLVKITDENGDVWHGGNQVWLFDHNNKDTQYLVAIGCPVIAIVDWILYREGTAEMTRAEYVDRAYQYLKANPVMLKDYLNCKGYVPVEVSNPDKSILNYLDSAVKKAGLSGADWNHEYKVNIEDIKDQLAHNIPVIYSTTQAREGYDKLKFYQKDENGELQLVTGEIPLSKVEVDIYKDAAKVLHKKYDATKPEESSICGHVMTITGVEEVADIHSGDVNTVFTISTWGREFYVKYEDMMEYRDIILDGKNQSQIDYHMSTGNNTTAHIDYHKLNELPDRHSIF